MTGLFKPGSNMIEFSFYKYFLIAWVEEGLAEDKESYRETG